MYRKAKEGGLTFSSWILVEYSLLLYNQFSTEQQKISFYYISGQNSSTVFHCTYYKPRTIMLASKVRCDVGSASLLSFMCTSHSSVGTYQAHSSSAFSICQFICQMLCSQTLVWVTLSYLSPSSSHVISSVKPSLSAPPKLAEGIFLYPPSPRSYHHFICFLVLSKSEIVRSVAHGLINCLSSVFLNSNVTRVRICPAYLPLFLQAYNSS